MNCFYVFYVYTILPWVSRSARSIVIILLPVVSLKGPVLMKWTSGDISYTWLFAPMTNTAHTASRAHGETWICYRRAHNIYFSICTLHTISLSSSRFISYMRNGTSASRIDVPVLTRKSGFPSLSDVPTIWPYESVDEHPPGAGGSRSRAWGMTRKRMWMGRRWSTACWLVRSTMPRSGVVVGKEIRNDPAASLEQRRLGRVHWL
jgi:hypothetical protein